MDARTADSERGSAQRVFDRLLHGGLIALLIASTMNGLSLEWRVSGTEFTVRPDQVVLVLLVPLVFLAFVLGRFRFQWTLFDWVVLGFFGSNFAASILSGSSPTASIRGAVLLAAYGAMYFVVKQILTNRAEWLPAATTWTLGLGIAQAAYCLIALVLYAFGHGIGGLQIGHLRAGSVAIKGTFWEANLLGAYLALMAIFLIIRYAWRTETRAGARTLWGLLITTLALPLTVTRAAGVALALGTVAIALVVWIFRREILEWRARAARIALTLCAVLLLTVTAMDDFVSGLSRYPNFLLERWIPISWSVPEGDAPEASAAGVEASADTPGPPVGDVTRASRSSVEGRVDAWAQALEGWRERPILGHGTLAGANLTKEGWWYSSLVQALFDTGLVGFVVLLWIYVGAVVLPVRSWLLTRQTSISPNLLGYGAGNAVLAFSSQFSSFLFVGFPWVFLGLSMAAVHASRTRGSRATAEAAHPTRPRPAVAELFKLGPSGADVRQTARDGHTD